MIAYDRLSQIIPSELALANKALQVALQQVNAIANMDPTTLANTTGQMETYKNLPLINAETTPVPQSVTNYYLSGLGIGTGVCNSILTVDMLGTAIGTVVAPALLNTAAQLSQVGTGSLQSMYSTMIHCANGDYTTGDPGSYIVTIPDGPAAGEYGPWSTAKIAVNDAFGNGLIPNAITVLNSTAASAPAQVAAMNAEFTKICFQMGNEQDLQHRAGLDFSNFFANLQASNQPAVFGFVFSLPGYGQDTIAGGKAQYIEGIADLSTLGGQAVIGVMREGRNQVFLNSAGIQNSASIPLTPDHIQPQANLLSSVYTPAEAAAIARGQSGL